MKLFIFLSLTLLLSCTTSKKITSQEGPFDEFQWLENIESEQSLAWVKEQNKHSVDQLSADPRYKKTYSEIESILENKDRLAYPTPVGNFIYNFWTDDKNPRGLWRRCSLEEYMKKDPNWEIVLDVDLLGKAEKESWVYKGSQMLKPDNKIALVFLSRGGKDAIEVREFDLESKSFIKNGFYLPEAKSDVAWFDQDHLLVGTDFGKGSMTTSGYPRIVKKWQRGTPLASAKTLYEIKEDEMQTYPFTIYKNNTTYRFIGRQINFYTYETFFINDDGKLVQLPIPNSSYLNDMLNNQVYFILKKDWTHKDKNYKSGSLISFDLKKFVTQNQFEPHLVYQSDAKNSLQSISTSKNKLWLEISQNVKPSVYEMLPNGKMNRIKLPAMGSASIASTDENSDNVFLSYSSFLIPTSLYFYKDKNLSLYKSMPQFFNEKKFSTSQFEATSKDGTKIPYFVVHKKNLKFNGKNATLLYAYGGFQVTMDPFYSGTLGKSWLEQDGVYVLANIRGGGEFGPQWHQAALKENRQRAFDDFYSVAEDLFKRKITSANHLAIKGCSNGGLLMGVALTQRPDLYKAVIVDVPLLDMLRFHKLLAGASWMAEYGNPEIPEEKAYLEKYSPYHNLKENKKYPMTFFTTSTKDDRVHPGHARKMSALMQKYKLSHLYYENTEGGHSAAADAKQRAKLQALQYIFLYKELLDSKVPQDPNLTLQPKKITQDKNL